MSSKSPIISVIIPIYNVAPYLRAAIDSVIKQTIGFNENVELILVNDGSPDNSGDICQEYSEKYPDNIIYINQKNQGVSAARNNGMKRARGKYVNFFDGDDIWSETVYKDAVDFMEAHGDTVDFVASKVLFFEANIASHPSNYKFHTTRVIDLTKDPDNPIFHLPTCVFKREALKGREFSKKLKISEDARILSEILLNKKAYGVLSGPHYNYRKRRDESSAINRQQKSRDFYTTVPKYAYLYMLDLWREEDGRVLPFMQYEVLSDLVWRLYQKKQNVLNIDEEHAYKDTIKGIVKQLDDEVIIKKRGIALRYRVQLLKMKHGAAYEKYLEVKNGKYVFNGITIASTKDSLDIHIDFIHYVGSGKYKIEGYKTSDGVSSRDVFVLRTSKGDYPLCSTRRGQREVSFLGDQLYSGGGFEVTIEVAPEDSLSAHLLACGQKDTTLALHTNAFSGLSDLQRTYTKKGPSILRREGELIAVYPYSSRRVARFELQYWLRIMRHWKLKDAKKLLNRVKTYNLASISLKARVFEVLKPFLLVAESVVMIPRTLLLRTIYFTIKPLLKRPIWLVSDRGTAAGDNGEAFFRHLQSRRDIQANVYFVISKKSPDYKRVKRYGKVVNQNGLYYRILFLLSDKVISSQADIETTNPFLRQMNHFVDLLGFDFVFLQHGIIRHDLSTWLNRYNKNIALFVTSAQKEYDSILRYAYDYSKENVILTGLPRYDLLESAPKGKLILAPTYRKDLARMKTDKNGARKYDNEFKKSDYRAFYNTFMNDSRVLEVLKKNNMHGEFYLHPAFAAQRIDFDANKYFSVKEYPYNYKKAFKEGNLLVSDYSSVMFDFAYLKKPIIYSQFDVETLYERHTYDQADFFSDENDGFGPIAYTYEALVKELVKVIEGGCTMPQKYKKRVDSFYYKNDQSNASRVYDAILKYDAKKRSIV